MKSETQLMNLWKFIYGIYVNVGSQDTKDRLRREIPSVTLFDLSNQSTFPPSVLMLHFPIFTSSDD